jgi:hypothetical protein
MGLLMKELGRLKPLNEDKGNSYLNLFHACSDDLLVMPRFSFIVSSLDHHEE